MTTPPSSSPKPTPDDAVRRRRRRRTDGPAPTASTGSDGSQSPKDDRRVSRQRTGDQRVGGLRALAPGAWGLSPTFRVFLFLGGILGVMAFLLYNEYVIQEFREQERVRANLYANLYGLAISESLPSEVSGDIFENIIVKKRDTFPVIVTDHRGRINNWSGPGLPDSTFTRKEALVIVRDVMANMDAVNEPVSAKWSNLARVRVYKQGEDLVLVDPEGYAIAWSGPNMPASTDTSAAGRLQAESAMQVLREGDVGHSVFHVSTDSLNHLVTSGADFAVARGDRMIAWGGPSLPPFVEGGPPSAAAQALYNGIAAGTEPLAFRVHNEQLIHYGDTQLMSQISLAPFVTIGVLLLFVGIGWVGSRNIRRSEQRSIWVGMAKETAHQLGTPLSSLSGWLELMNGRVRDLVTADAGAREGAAMSVDTVVSEMQKDMGRLNQIASRFSQIGSVPELKETDVRDVIRDTVGYFKGRGPQFGRHDFALDLATVPAVPLNAELMGWVFENLFKNAIDAMVQQEGCIRVSTNYDDERHRVRILVEDNGRGIDSENLARVFQPGFSTKKRGWGLGLAFVRRIVEEYHGGHIHIPRSESGTGTTFEINLPA
ncbi:MAG: HAMP domain-containing sensor histidine kinase [Candidatus Latescibacterota bacterium]|nr:HAMP domain-containing sensor histidine kinase [Candidatus Latescibacterota bacterium]